MAALGVGHGWVARALRWNVVFVVLWLSVLGIGVPGFASAAAVNEDDILRFNMPWALEDEIPQLPPYCQVKRRVQALEGGTVPPDLAREQAAWVKVVGAEVWEHLHHYCAGVTRMNRFYQSLEAGVGGTSGITERQALTLEYALRELGYTEGYMLKARSPLYADDIVRQADALNKLGRTDDAMRKILDGLKQMPDRDLLYVALGDLLISDGQVAEARAVLNLGLKKTGGAKSIKDLLSRLP